MPQSQAQDGRAWSRSIAIARRRSGWRRTASYGGSIGGWSTAGVVFLSLPAGESGGTGGAFDEVFSRGSAPGRSWWISAHRRSILTRTLAHEFAQRGAAFVDAPVARTRAAAEAGTLAVMVGADAVTFDRCARSSQPSPAISRYAVRWVAARW